MNKEIECRFLEVDKNALIDVLRKLGATDLGEILLEETIIYDRELTWQKSNKFMRLRRSGGKTRITYKEHRKHELGGAYEIETDIGDYDGAQIILEKAGLVLFRHQQKRRHSFQFGNVTFDIDTWPRLPPYVELEGPSEEALMEAAKAVDLDWNKADFHDARWVIENVYKIPVGELRWFTFEKVE